MSTQDLLNTAIFTWGPTVLGLALVAAMLYGLFKAFSYVINSLFKRKLQPGLIVISAYFLGAMTGYSLYSFNLGSGHSVIVISETTASEGFINQPKKTVIISEPGRKLIAVPVDFNQIKARLRQYMTHEDQDPMMSPSYIYNYDESKNLSTVFSQEEIAAYNALHILPFRQVLRKNCKLIGEAEKHEDLKTYKANTDAWQDSLKEKFYYDGGYGQTCAPLFEMPQHPYFSLSIAELRPLALAGDDAIAMLFYGRRHSELFDNWQENMQTIETGKIQWTLRAAVLSGKPGPIMWLANFAWDTERRLTLEFLGRMLADPRADPEKYKDLLAEKPDGEAKIESSWQEASKYYAFVEQYRASRLATDTKVQTGL